MAAARDERHIHQGAGGDAPKRGARAWRRVHIGHSAERPQHDLVRFSSNLPAGQRVAVLMKHHNEKQCQILQCVPGKRRIAFRPTADFKRRHQKPGPVQKQINPGETKQMNRSLATGRHVRDL
jgi:hypothetical protein